MSTIDCDRCPQASTGCEGCILDVLLGQNVQVEALDGESCGYVLAPEVHRAIDVLRAAGLVSEVEILAVEGAA